MEEMPLKYRQELETEMNLAYKGKKILSEN